MEGKTVLLPKEAQQLSSFIQFCRYASGVAGRSARVVLEVHRPLHDLMCGPQAQLAVGFRHETKVHAGGRTSLSGFN